MTAGRPDLRAGATLLAWLAFLIATILGLHALGGALAPPPLTDPGELTGWAEAREPAEAAFALLRLVALGTAWYLLLATMASALARLSRVPAAVRAADMLAVPAVRRLVSAAAGVSVAAATLTTGAAMASAGTDRLRYPAMEALAVLTGTGTDPADLPTGTGTPSNAGAGEPTDHRLDEEILEPPTLRRLPDHQPEPPPQDPQPVQWQVQPGQHFWAVAEKVLASAWQRAPSDAEIDPYWRHLVETNRSILRDPTNPDLLYPGQVLTVPPPPPPGSAEHPTG
ncbi:MAG TPA: hypothetical protein VM142_10715 [Acidimicrobiales bacterium]|nr:hypothetical protein [Acidimicrobiales bacterium]